MFFSQEKLKRIGWRASQIALLIGVFVVGGFFLPMRLAPAVFDYLPYTTPQEQEAKQWSVQISNRNANSGQEFLVAARNPRNSLAIADVSYSCEIDDVQIIYETDSGNKKLPCGTSVVLPNNSDHRFRVYTNRDDVAYLPISLSVTDGDKQRNISVVLATTQTGIDQKSRVDDTSVVTFDEL